MDAPAQAPVRVTAEQSAAQAVDVDQADAAALIALCERQLAEARRALATTDPGSQQHKVLQARLDRIELLLTTAATAVVRVQFPNGRTDFQPTDEMGKVLVPAAKSADRINLRGRTDSRVPGPADARIALGRAIAARKYLMDKGVDGSKILRFRAGRRRPNRSDHE